MLEYAKYTFRDKYYEIKIICTYSFNKRTLVIYSFVPVYQNNVSKNISLSHLLQTLLFIVYCGKM